LHWLTLTHEGGPAVKSVVSKGSIVRGVLSALAVAVFGYVLLNAAFIFYFLLQSSIRALVGLVTPVDLFRNSWLLMGVHVLFVIVIGLISWLILKSRLGTLYKAIYLTVPFAVVFVTIGILLFRWPAAAYLSSGLFAAGVLYYLHRTRQPWLYYYTLVLIGLTLLISNLLGMEI
jgi:hypothetical protein